MQTLAQLNYIVADKTDILPQTSNNFLFDHPQSSATGLLDFKLPAELEAGEPPEARGLARDEVRLMVSHYSDNRVTHTQFRNLPDYLEAGDLLVINTSGTLNAAVKAIRTDGTPLEVHLSTHLPANLWIVEVRQPNGSTTQPFYQAVAGERLTLPGGASVMLHTPYLSSHRSSASGPVRLWIATLRLPNQISANDYLAEYGFPIRYYYVKLTMAKSRK